MTTADSAASNPRFAGLKVLVLEDETIVSLLIEDMLSELGCATIWHAADLPEALRLLGEQRPDAAVLDVNLRGQSVYPVAERLELSGVPFLFATGYGGSGIPPQWASRPVLQKPFQIDALAAGLSAALRA